MFIRKPSTRAILVCVCGRYKTGWEETKHWPNVEQCFWKKLIWEIRHRSLTMFIWVALNEKCQTSKDVMDNFRNMFELILRNLAHTFLRVLWCGRSCKEMRGTILRTGEQNNSTVIQSRNTCIDDHQIKEEENGSVGELSTVCSQIVLKCLYLARFGRPRHSMVSKQICSCGHKVDQSLRQTFRTFVLLHSSHEWIQTILWCGENCTTMQVGTVSGLWLCRRSWRLKINLRRTLVHIWKSYICSPKLDV